MASAANGGGTKIAVASANHQRPADRRTWDGIGYVSQSRQLLLLFQRQGDLNVSDQPFWD